MATDAATTKIMTRGTDIGIDKDSRAIAVGWRTQLGASRYAVYETQCVTYGVQQGRRWVYSPCGCHSHNTGHRAKRNVRIGSGLENTRRGRKVAAGFVNACVLPSIDRVTRSLGRKVGAGEASCRAS
jgi:hypothetical protein